MNSAFPATVLGKPGSNVVRQKIRPNLFGSSSIVASPLRNLTPIRQSGRLGQLRGPNIQVDDISGLPSTYRWVRSDPHRRFAIRVLFDHHELLDDSVRNYQIRRRESRIQATKVADDKPVNPRIRTRGVTWRRSAVCRVEPLHDTRA